MKVAHLETVGSWGEVDARSYFKEDRSFPAPGEMARGEPGVGLRKDVESG